MISSTRQMLGTLGVHSNLVARTLFMSADTEPLVGQRYSLLWCSTCARTVVCNRVEILGFLRSGWPRCCQSEMGLFIEAERPIPGDTRVIAGPLTLPGSNEGTAIIPVPTARTPR